MSSVRTTATVDILLLLAPTTRRFGTQIFCLRALSSNIQWKEFKKVVQKGAGKNSAKIIFYNKNWCTLGIYLVFQHDHYSPI